ncbi:MAG: HutP family protein [bacterium]
MGTGIDLRLRADTLGRVAILCAMADDPSQVIAAARSYRVVLGSVGTMDVQKVIAAVETAARREALISQEYAEEHALYHATIEALQGVGRGQLALGTLLRTVGLRFALARGPRLYDDRTEWIAVAFFGTIGQPIKGNEHEVVGLGIQHL